MLNCLEFKEWKNVMEDSMFKSLSIDKNNNHTYFNTLLDQALMKWEYYEASNSHESIDVSSCRIGGMTVSRLKGDLIKGYRSGDTKIGDNERQIGIVYNLKGSEKLFWQGQEFTFLPGDINIWRNDLELRFELQEAAERLIILLPEHRLEPYFTSLIDLPQVWNNPLETAQGSMLQSIFTALAQNLDRIDSYSIESILKSCLALLAHSDIVGYKPALKETTSLYQRILIFIDHHLESDITPQSIATAHQISVRYLHLIFAKQGINVSSWIREQRLLRCRDLLEYSLQPINLTELAYRWHFCDSSHFSRLFKKRFGVSPKYWRNGK